MSNAAFGSRALPWLAGICGGSLLLGLIIGALGTDLTGHRSTGADSFSNSALGHKAFLELMRESGVPVTRNLGDVTTDAGRVLLVAEPRLDHAPLAGVEAWDRLYDLFYDIVIVLPKREGLPDPGRPGWIARTWLLDRGAVNRTLDELGIPGEVVRLPEGARPTWHGSTLPAGRPSLAGAQLLVSDELEPVWSAEEGMLVARWRPDPEIDETILVVSDPDLIANHGLGRGVNAALALSLLYELGGAGGGVVVDETIHGYGRARSVWRSLFRFPLSLVLIQLLLAGAALVWLATGRFGAARPLDPPHGSGLEYLIDNTAGLLPLGGHAGMILRRYRDAAVAAVARELRLEGTADSERLHRDLQRIGKARGVEPGLHDLDLRVHGIADERAPRESTLLAVAGAIHRWQREMTHGL